MGHHSARHLEAAGQAVHETSCLPGECEAAGGWGPKVHTVVAVTPSAVPQHSQASLGGSERSPTARRSGAFSFLSFLPGEAKGSDGLGEGLTRFSFWLYSFPGLVVQACLSEVKGCLSE